MIPRFAVAASPAEYVTGVLRIYSQEGRYPLDKALHNDGNDNCAAALNLPNRKSTRTCDNDEN